MSLRKKILMISDHIGIPSGVGHMSALIATHFVQKGLQVVQLGGAVKHPNYEIQNINGVKVYPVDVYGSPDDLRRIIMVEKPDCIFLFTDPRYFEWVWNMEDELRDKMPIFYYHVWDSDPIPKYNEKWYKSCDYIACISKMSHHIVSSFGVPSSYVPHGVNPDIFKPLEDRQLVESHRTKIVKKAYEYDENTFWVFWNNRNIRRKIPGQIMWIFDEFNKKIKNSIMVMHTNVIDGEGTDLYAIKEELYPNAQIIFTDFKIEQQFLNIMYNMMDVTMNLSFNEGFGLSTLESMSAGVPIIVNMTGGLQDQIEFDGKKCGIGIPPDTRTIVGSVPTPYIFDDRVSMENGLKALMDMYNLGKEGRKEFAMNARENVLQNFSSQKMCETLFTLVNQTIENYKPRIPWKLEEVK